MVQYAEALGIDVGKAKNEQGQLSENRLVILIHDTEGAGKLKRNEGVGAFAGGVFVFAMIVVAVWLVIKIFK